MFLFFINLSVIPKRPSGREGSPKVACRRSGKRVTISVAWYDTGRFPRETTGARRTTDPHGGALPASSRRSNAPDDGPHETSSHTAGITVRKANDRETRRYVATPR